MSNQYHAYLLSVIPSLSFFFLIGWDGLLLTNDSELYLVIANQILENQQIYGRSGRPVIYWPPGYPIFLIPQLLWENYLFVSHAILLLSTQMVCSKIAFCYLGGTKKVFLLMMGFSTLILMISVFIWSELLFTCCLLFAIWKFNKYFEFKKNTDLLLGAGFLTIALLTRNAGLFIIPGLLAYGILNLSKKNRKKTILAITAACISILSWNIHKIIWLGNNQILTELIPYFDPIRNLNLIFSEIGYNFFPRLIPSWIISLITLTFLITYSKFRSGGELYSYILFSYLLFWVFIPANEHDMARFIAPLYPIILLILILGIQRLFRHQPKLQLLTFIYLVSFSMIKIYFNLTLWATNE